MHYLRDYLRHAPGLDDAYVYTNDLPFHNTTYSSLTSDYIKNNPELCYVKDNECSEIMFFDSSTSCHATANNIEMFLQQMVDTQNCRLLKEQKFIPYGYYDISEAIKTRPLYYFNVEDKMIYFYDNHILSPIPTIEIPESAIMENEEILINTFCEGSDYVNDLYTYQQHLLGYGINVSIDTLHHKSRLGKVWLNTITLA